jgi:glycosyltransferase involved in cell wall biosynthesis
MARNGIFIYDNLFFRRKLGGVDRYFRHICDALIDQFGEQASFFSSQSRQYGQARHLPAIPTNFRGSRQLGIPQINNLLANWTIKKMHPSVFYSPYYGSVKTEAAQVFTVYDMIHELFLPRTRKHLIFIDEKKRCLEQASLLLSISKSTGRDIIAYYPQVNPSKIVTTWLGVDEFFFEVPLIPDRRQKPYFLYVGARRGYKNFQRTLQAYGQSGLGKEFDFRVISPGRSDIFTEEELSLLSRYNLEGYVNLQLAVSDSELRAIYSGAVALVYPSEYEGFGLPVLEAMAAGTVVVASFTASIPEIAGNKAIYFDPKSIDSIIETLKVAAAMPEAERLSRISQGIDLAHKFTWARCQQETVEAILRLLPS